MAALGPEIFARGFRFNPTPLEAATYYLPRLIAGTPLHNAVRTVVHHADIYACEPGDLAAQFSPLPKTGHRFFFTSCKKGTRVAGPGSWTLQSTKAVRGGADQAEVVGEIKKFRYKKGGVMTDWLMDEYSCCLEDAIVGDRQFVLCNIYVYPRALANSAARQESAAFFAQPAPAHDVAMTPAAAKRPAPPQVLEPPCPKRMRRAVAPTPPVVQLDGCTASFAPPRPYVASAQPLPPVPTFAAPPKQQMPPPIPPAYHMPVQAPAHHYRPQPSAQTKQSMRDPFEAAELRDEAEKESVPASDPAQDFDIDEFCKTLEEYDNFAELAKLFEDEDNVPTAEADQAAANCENSTMADPTSKESPAVLHEGCFSLDYIMSLPYAAFEECLKSLPVDIDEDFKVPQEAIQVT